MGPPSRTDSVEIDCRVPSSFEGEPLTTVVLLSLLEPSTTSGANADPRLALGNGSSSSRLESRGMGVVTVTL